MWVGSYVELRIIHSSWLQAEFPKKTQHASEKLHKGFEFRYIFHLRDNSLYLLLFLYIGAD